MKRELKIGEWRFRPDLHQLQGPGGRLQLEPRTAEVLRELARNTGEVRSREDLLTAVWGDAFVGEAVLTHCIWQLRKGFGDDARRPRYIQTVPSRGYRLIATTTWQRAPVVLTLVASHLGEPTVRSEPATPGLEAIARERHRLLIACGGSEVKSADGLLCAFERPIQAVRFALELQALDPGEGSATGVGSARLGIHMDEVRIRSVTSDGLSPSLEAEGPATGTAVRLKTLAAPGQILLTRGIFDVARHTPDEAAVSSKPTRWLAHGPYQLAGMDEPVGIFEVGEEGRAAMHPPPDSEVARRGIGDGTILGWRPAPGLSLPQRPHWHLQKRLGKGGFGEIWLARNPRTGEQRVLKFCYDAERLRALQREVTIFRLIKEELGERPDIGRILDWNFDEPPYFLEIEHTESGSLVDWSDARGGLGNVPLEDRLQLIRELAEALAAAHSVGVLHKDIKPANVLVYLDHEGRPRPRLTDFGIGRLSDRSRLDRAGVTGEGLTRTANTASSDTGTRLYLAPEVVEGKAATVQADIFALGVVFYQVVIGDLGRALAPGWERDIDDELLREDIAAAVDGTPSRRLASALELAERIANRRRRAEERAEDDRQRQALERTERNKRWAVLAAIVSAFVALVLGLAVRRVSNEAARANQEARAAQQVARFLGHLFRDVEPGEDLGRTYAARELLDLGARRARTELADQPRIQAQLLNTIGVAYRSLGLFEPAGDLIEQALVRRRETLGEDHVEVAESLHDKAVLLTHLGAFERAGPLHLEALAIRRKTLGEQHLTTAESLHSLAWLRRLEGTPEVAEPLYRQALEIRRERLGEAHVEVASSVSSLALCLRAQGEFELADPLYRQALAMRRALLGERHPSVAASLNNLAGLLRSRGDAAAAVPLLRQALDIRLETLGGRHPEIAASLNNLARALRMTGEYDEAEALFQRALALRRELLGPDHPRVAQTLGYWAELLVDRGEPRAAERAAGEALPILQDTLGPDHWRVRHAESVLASAWTGLGRFEEAEPLLLAGYRTLRDQRGEASSFARDARARIIALYEAWGRDRDSDRFHGGEPERPGSGRSSTRNR